MKFIKSVDTVMDQLSDRTLTVLGYYAMLPFYLWLQILFEDNGPDSLGRYGYLTEWGLAKYD